MFKNMSTIFSLLTVVALMATMTLASGCGTQPEMAPEDEEDRSAFRPVTEGGHAVLSVAILEKKEIADDGFTVRDGFALVSEREVTEDTAILLKFGRGSEYRVAMIPAGKKESIMYPFPEAGGTVSIMAYEDLLTTSVSKTPDGKTEFSIGDYNVQGNPLCRKGRS